MTAFLLSVIYLLLFSVIALTIPHSIVQGLLIIAYGAIGFLCGIEYEKGSSK